MNQFELTQGVYDEIVAHARMGKPEEVCGILRGRAARAFQLVRGRNIASDPIKDFDLDPQTLLRQFDFEEEGDEMVAIYHSHPVSPAYPSASDAWNAHYPDAAFIICSLEDEDHPTIRGFRLTPHGIPLELAQLRASLDFTETRPGRFGYFQAPDAPLPSILTDLCGQIPLPFYIVYESVEVKGKDPTIRVVSVKEYRLRFVP